MLSFSPPLSLVFTNPSVIVFFVVIVVSFITDHQINDIIDQFVSALNAFTVDARGTETTGDGKVSASVKTPSGKKVNTFVENKNDGTYKVTYILPEEGMKSKKWKTILINNFIK